MKFTQALQCILLGIVLGYIGSTFFMKVSKWYPIEGGYVNLDQIKHIRTEAFFALKNYDGEIVSTLIDGPITQESIQEAKEKLYEKAGPKCSYSASIELDGFTVKLPSLENWESDEDIEHLLDKWLRIVKDLSHRVGVR